MEKHKSKVAILILMVMLITGMTSVIGPTLVYAEINHNTGLGDSNPSGKGSETWVYSGEGVKPYGMRISLYHAPSLDVFNGVSGDKSQIKKVGQTREFTSYMPAAKYATQHSTGMSAVDYMTFGEDQDIRYHTWVKNGYHRTIGGPLVAKMPEILNSSTEEWRVFFAGKDHQNNPDYTNVSAILKEMGVTLSPEDFKNGIYRDKFNNTQRGVYKLFWEPVAYFRAGGFNSAFTFRDMAVWEQKFLPRKNNRDVASFYLGDKGADISNQNRSVIANTGNSHFLAEDEPALGMKGKPKGYRVPNTSKEQRLAVQKGTTGWLSMGVGVLTPKPVEAPKNKVLVSYVKVVDYKDGKFIYETIKETEEEAVKYIKGKEAEGILDIDAVREVEEGTAVLNDVITTKNDYTEKVVEKKKEVKDLVWETGIKPKLKEEPIVEPEDVLIY